MARRLALALIVCSIVYIPALPQQARRRPKARVSPNASAPDTLFNTKSDATRWGELDELLRRYIKDDCLRPRRDPCTTPGAAVMVLQRDRVVYEQYMGAADLEKRLPINEDTVFDLASVSKQFTAMAVILLRAQGKLDSFDRTLGSFNFPGVEFDPVIARAVTVRHLLNHTSGLKDVTKLYEEAANRTRPACMTIHLHYPRSARAFREPGAEPTALEALKCIAGQGEADLEFRPGQAGKWKYNNAGYIILAQLVESLSGERFRDFMRKNIFEPLRMSHTFVMDETTVTPANRAVSYHRGFDQFHDIDYTPLNKIYGDGNVNTNLRDMAKWDRALHVILNRDQYPGETPLVDERFVAEAFNTPDQTTNPRINYSSGWFFGLYRKNLGRDRKLMWHTGGWAGFRSAVVRFAEPDPQEHLTVILLSNHMLLPPSVVACKIAKQYLRALDGPVVRLPLSDEQLQKVVSNYHRERDVDPFSDDITLEDGVLWVKDFTLEKYRLNLHTGATLGADAGTDGARQTFVFYLDEVEGFDIFRYDIMGERITPPPDAKDFRFTPRTQRN